MTFSRQPRVIGLFSGCGGLDFGFKSSGFEIVYANDIEAAVKETYEHNLGHEIQIADIRKVDKSKIPAGDLVLAGIPCQPFSSAGKRESTRTSDGNLFLEVLDVVLKQDNLPSVVLFENVKGFLSSRDETGTLMTQRFKAEMNEIGYDSFFQLLNASDYGVPSNRERVFVVCIRKDLGVDFSFPTPHVMSHKTTVGEVLSTPLPDDEEPEIWDLSPSTMQIIDYIPEGGSWKAIPYEKLSDRHKKIRDNMKKYHSPNFYRRFGRNEVMGTVTAAATPENSGILHPLENRRYSVREVARFQSYPDHFKFLGSSVSSKYRMIGNSVPPKLAEAVAREIMAQVFQLPYWRSENQTILPSEASHAL